MSSDLAESLLVVAHTATALQWPSLRYRKDPVAFCRDVLGFEPWAKQVEILESVRDHPLTSVKSGHRIGKSSVAAAIALWFYSSFEEARVVCTAPGTRQVEGILWREIRRLHGRAPKLDGSAGQKPATGLVSDDSDAGVTNEGLVTGFREVRGYTAKDVEAITGTAGANLLFIMDEASGVADAIYEGLEGNRAGWSESPGVMVRMLLIGNPTRTRGEFYDSHEHPKKKLVYNRITVSSRETPNAVNGTVEIPGLATREWIAQMEAKYGKDSAFVKVRVDGEFPIGEDGKAFSIDLIHRSEERWHDEEGAGPLYIGIDPAGENGTGDDTCMSARRGNKQLALRTWIGLSEALHGMHLLDLIEELRADDREKAIVILDSEGPVGTKVARHLAKIAAKRNATFELHQVRASWRAIREPITFGTVRDELAHNLGRWMRDGGAILEDEMLEAELHALEWERVSGKSKITPKKKIRSEIGRSPDRYDALALSVWEPSSASKRSHAAEDDDDEEDDDLDDRGLVDERIDPYGGRIDPYGHR